ncbi:MAG: low specificity L-threonine aldolase [Bacteroidales bacterium]|jgi:threonine aldolase|nr:low specificity L-threonine aldolase [Bacteroidales bacterium]
MKRGFGSDNHSGVHPSVIEAIVRANSEHAVGYGDDDQTARVTAAFKEQFGANAKPFFVFNGTGANVLALKATMQSFHAVVCAETAHIHVDECGAPEHFTGCKLLTINTPDGKLMPELVQPYLHGFGDQHHAQPKVISISQPTELGTLYQPEEIERLTDLAHKHNMYLHIDGARFANAAAALNQSFKELSVDLGVDALSFGGTKNGLMMAESVVCFRPELAENFRFFRKQAAQLFSKMRFIAAQFEAYFENELWRKLALHSNRMAQLLAKEAAMIQDIRITQKVEANAVFAIIDPKVKQELLKEYFFYDWDETKNEVRWMCSWDTTEEDIFRFIETIRKIAR